jgi:nucleoside-diphosphate-sugar epimerase
MATEPPHERVLVTGAAGFIGSAVVQDLERRGYEVRAATRTGLAGFSDEVAVGDIGPGTDWSTALRGVQRVVHCAGRAHKLVDTATDPLGEFRRVNRDATLALARQSAQCGIRRLVFLSSLGVMGGETEGRGPYTQADVPNPVWDYAISKWEAESALRTLQADTGLEVVVLRPPMVYGPHAPANFRRLLSLVRSGLPLPLASVRNQRSMVSIQNLTDLVAVCLVHPDAAGQAFLLSDNQDVSTPELIRRIAALMGRRAPLWPVPVSLLRLGGRLIGRSSDVQRLVGSLAVDIGHTRRSLQWSPPWSLDEGLAAAVRWYVGREE